MKSLFKLWVLQGKIHFWLSLLYAVLPPFVGYIHRKIGEHDMHCSPLPNSLGFKVRWLLTWYWSSDCLQGVLFEYMHLHLFPHFALVKIACALGAPWFFSPRVSRGSVGEHEGECWRA